MAPSTGLGCPHEGPSVDEGLDMAPAFRVLGFVLSVSGVGVAGGGWRSGVGGAGGGCLLSMGLPHPLNLALVMRCRVLVMRREQIFKKWFQFKTF